LALSARACRLVIAVPFPFAAIVQRLFEPRAEPRLSAALALGGVSYLYLLTDILINVPVPKPLLLDLVERLVGSR
jgi:hypothetical protein